MDLKPVEAALTEVGKTFRLSRLYPQTHPSVQQALAELAAALPAVSAQGAIELRIGTAGFLAGATPVASKNPQIQEFSGLLYAQGYRLLVIEPGVSADEFGALARMAATAGKSGQTLGAQARFQPLPHLKLESGVRRSSSPPASAPRRETIPTDSPMGRRTMAEFRPDALPPEIEASRLLEMLEMVAPEEAARRLARLAALAPGLLDQRNFGAYARMVAGLAHWKNAPASDATPAVVAAQKGLMEAVTKTGLAALVTRLSDPSAAPQERDAIVKALGGLGAQAVAPVAEAFAAAGEDQRDLLLAIMRHAGEAAVPVLVTRLDAEARGETARGVALMLGATQSAAAVPSLVTLARHAEAPVRAAAVQGLGRLKGPEAERLVVGALRDPDPEVRVAAARGIAWFGTASVVPILLVNLQNEHDTGVVQALVTTLGELRDARAVPRLADLARGVIGLFQRHPSSVRAAAVRALAQVGTPDAMAIVATFRTDRNSDIRKAAEDSGR